MTEKLTEPASRYESAVTTLSGVGPALAERLHKLGLYTLGDLALHLPIRYQDRTRVTPLSQVRPGQECLVEAEVTDTRITFGRRRTLQCMVADPSGTAAFRLFHFSASQQSGLAGGTRVRLFGEARLGPGGIEFVHPEYQRLGAKPPELPNTLTPIYGITEGLGQNRIRKLVDAACREILSDPALELLPPRLPLLEGLPDTEGALRRVHQPPPGLQVDALRDGSDPAIQRLALEELLAHQLGMRLRRRHAQSRQAAPLPCDDQALDGFRSNLPFQLTGDQNRAVDEILNDLARPVPMMRLLQGDVGSGKTVVAAAAMAQAACRKLQACLMAPTEILADQHFRNLHAWLSPLGIKVGLLTGKTRAAERTKLLASLANGSLELVVGTHALFQADVLFHHLAMVVIDEQHRFGVAQRLALAEKSQVRKIWPHQLVMTATPIPRTLSMSLYADLDYSCVRELPPGRTPVETVAVSTERREQVIERIQAACGAGRQAYWVCTLIEESEELDCQAAEKTAADLSEVLSGLEVGLVHGRMSAKEKSEVMRAFKSGAINVLVATTVIEVGVDVPAASLIVIENAERLGLSQLHQLRGRVGRGDVASYCVLLYQGPLSNTARQRLQVLRETNDGFEIAEEDLKLRGPGELLGTRQTGLAQFRIADLVRDAHLLEPVHQLAEQICTQHPRRVEPLIQRWLAEGGAYADA